MLGLEAISSEIRRAEDIGAAFEALKDRVHALYVGADPLALTQVIRIALLSLDDPKPVFWSFLAK